MAQTWRRGAQSVVRCTKEVSRHARSSQWARALWLFHQFPARPDVVSFGAALSACKHGAQWNQALGLLQMMVASRLAPNALCVSIALDACGRASRWQTTFQLLAASRAQGVVLDIVAYNVVASACVRLSMWSRAMEVQQQALLSNLPLSAVSYNSALSACEKSSRWESALHLLSEAMTSGFRDIVGHSSAISACEKATLWPLALSLLWKAPMDVIGFSAAISACEKGLQWELALDALGACQPDAICCSSAIVACVRSSRWAHAALLMSGTTDPVSRMLVLGAREEHMPFPAGPFWPGDNYGESLPVSGFLASRGLFVGASCRVLSRRIWSTIAPRTVSFHREQADSDNCTGNSEEVLSLGEAFTRCMLEHISVDCWKRFH